VSDFSLTELIESVQGHAGPDAADIAAKVEPLIPESERHAVFLMLLTRYIVASKPRLTQVIAHPTRPAREFASSVATAPRPVRSAKVAAYREHAKFLRLNVKVGRGERKWMEECTHADLIAAAEIRRGQAAATNAAAEQFEALAALVKRHKVTTVGALPPAVLDKFLCGGRVAA
jgi:hypothetical protein